jgi:hypothetical protein
MISVAVTGLKRLNMPSPPERASHPLLEPITHRPSEGMVLSLKERCVRSDAADGQQSRTRRSDGDGGASAHRHAVQASRALA